MDTRTERKTDGRTAKKRMAQTPAARELARRELARRYLGDYLCRVNGPGWIRTAFSRFLAQRIQDFLETDTGHAYDILLIEAPPQHGKSMTVTESVPGWYLGRNPDARVIVAGYNDEFAERFCRRNKEKLRRHGRNLFGVSIGPVDRADEFELDGQGGRFLSRGILAGITGNPANLLVIDDPVKNRQEADSPAYRERVWEEWQNSLKSRLAAGARVLVIMTPWHEDDFAARLQRTEPNLQLLRLPAEAEENDPMGRPPGAPLCPELGRDARWLREFKGSYLRDSLGGARAWSALYQCSPRPEGGNLVPRAWWRFYDRDRAGAFAAEVISVDAAFKGAGTSDFVAVTVWGKRENNYYLRHCLNRRLDFPATLAAIRAVRAQFPNARAVLIEDKANGPAIIQTLSREMFCIPVNPLGGKTARVNAVSPAIESGHVFLPAGEGWVAEFLDQWSAFPAGAHDDMVDSSTQALSWLLRAPGERAKTAPEGADPFGAEAYEVYG